MAAEGSRWVVRVGVGGAEKSNAIQSQLHPTGGGKTLPRTDPDTLNECLVELRFDHMLSGI